MSTQYESPAFSSQPWITFPLAYHPANQAAFSQCYGKTKANLEFAKSKPSQSSPKSRSVFSKVEPLYQFHPSSPEHCWPFLTSGTSIRNYFHLQIATFWGSCWCPNRSVALTFSQFGPLQPKHGKPSTNTRTKLFLKTVHCLDLGLLCPQMEIIYSQ